MKTSKLVQNVAFALLLMVTLTSCFNEDPGPIQQESRELAHTDFTHLRMGDALEVRVQQGTIFAISVAGDRRNLDDLEVISSGGTLSVKYKNNRNRRHDTRVDITMPTLNGVNFSGAVEAKITGFSSAEDFDLVLSGASELEISGKVLNLHAKLSGASELEGYAFESEDATVDASGASSIKVFATRSLKAKASGASDIRYRGTPAVTVNISGASTVKAE